MNWATELKHHGKAYNNCGDILLSQGIPKFIRIHWPQMSVYEYINLVYHIIL